MSNSQVRRKLPLQHTSYLTPTSPKSYSLNYLKASIGATYRLCLRPSQQEGVNANTPRLAIYGALMILALYELRYKNEPTTVSEEKNVQTDAYNKKQTLALG